MDCSRLAFRGKTNFLAIDLNEHRKTMSRKRERATQDDVNANSYSGIFPKPIRGDHWLYRHCTEQACRTQPVVAYRRAFKRIRWLTTLCWPVVDFTFFFDHSCEWSDSGFIRSATSGNRVHPGSPRRYIGLSILLVIAIFFLSFTTPMLCLIFAPVSCCGPLR